MKDRLEELGFYKMAMELWDDFWKDSEILMNDLRGKEIARQLTKSIGSTTANIEEGYGRGFGKEYPHFLKNIQRFRKRKQRMVQKVNVLIG